MHRLSNRTGLIRRIVRKRKQINAIVCVGSALCLVSCMLRSGWVSLNIRKKSSAFTTSRISIVPVGFLEPRGDLKSDTMIWDNALIVKSLAWSAPEVYIFLCRVEAPTLHGQLFMANRWNPASYCTIIQVDKLAAALLHSMKIRSNRANWKLIG